MSAVEPDSMLAAAMKYAARGVPVFPVRATTKTPLAGSHGFKDATTDERQIIDWWGRKCPNAAIGVPTGQVTGKVVVDVDPRHGGVDGIAECSDRLGKLPTTATVTTPGGGWHFWLRAPEGIKIVSRSGKIAEGVDVRGDGGFAIVPPSRNGMGRWEWSTRVKAADLPAAWQAAMSAATPGPDGAVAATPAAEWVRLVRGPICEGTRNDAMTRLVGHFLRRYVDFDLVLEVALAINTTRCSPPLPVAEVEAIVDSVARAEARARRRRRTA